MKRVLVVIHAPKWGGLHTLVERVAPVSASMGYEWVVLLPRTGADNGRRRLEAAGIRVVEIPLRRIRKTANLRIQAEFLLTVPLDVWRLMQVIRREKIDFVQVCGLIHFHSAIAGKLTGRPVIWQLHSDQPPRLLRKFFTPWVVRLADAVMTSGAALVKSHPGLERAASRTVPFRAPVDTAVFHPNPTLRQEARALIGAAPSDVVVGVVGGRGPNKNHQLAVEAAKITKDRGLPVKYAICGHWLPQHRSFYEAEVIGRARDLGLDDTVSFHEPGDKVPLYMNAFDIFALPSLGEGASIVTAEAMATGIPVVANDVGALRDTVNSEVGALNKSCSAAELAEHVETLINNGNLRATLSQSARTYAEQHFSLSACANAHAKAYDLAIHSICK